MKDTSSEYRRGFEIGKKMLEEEVLNENMKLKQCIKQLEDENTKLSEQLKASMTDYTEANRSIKRLETEAEELIWLRNKFAGIYCDNIEKHAGKLCQELGVEFISVRYMIDRADRKAMPIGINHLWRKRQHFKMQNKFNLWLKENV